MIKKTGEGGSMLMSMILIPTQNAEDWKRFLAEPEKQWKSGYSARTLAHCWQDAADFPNSVKSVLLQVKEFAGLEMVFAIPEYKIHLPGGTRPSQNDIWVLARTHQELVSIAVEGKVSEPFGPTIGDWSLNSSEGKKERLKYLISKVGLIKEPPSDIRYQLLHRTASAIIEADRLHAHHAVMLVHSFSQSDECFTDYKRFLSLYGIEGELNSLVTAGDINGIKLHFAWVRGDEKYLLM